MNEEQHFNNRVQDLTTSNHRYGNPKCISLLNGFLEDFFKEGVNTYLMAPMSAINVLRSRYPSNNFF
jgi:hypothetical protein